MTVRATEQHDTSAPSPEQVVSPPAVAAAYLGLGLVSLLFGANFLVLKVALQDLSPLVFAPVRFLIGTATLFVFLRALEPHAPPAPITLGWRPLLFVAFLGIALASLLFTVSLSLTSAAHGAIINATSPLLGVLLVALVQRQRPSAATMAALALSFAGVVVVVLARAGAAGPAGAAELWGDLAMFGSAAAWSFYGVRLRPLLVRQSALAVSAYATGLGALMLLVPGLPLVLSTPWTHLPPGVWLALAYSGVLVTGVANPLWVHAIRVVGVSSTMIYQYLPTVVGVGLAVWLLHEPLLPQEFLGAACVLVGVGLSTRETMGRRR